MICVGCTDIGTKRKNNQDTFRIEQTDLYAYAVVCDGMGGAKGGSVASTLAADTFARSVRGAMKKRKSSPTSGDLRRIMISALEDANRAVYELEVSDIELEGMGTTLVAFLDSGNAKTVVLNVGDSRLYKLSNGRLTQISKDHSFVQFLIDNGAITREEARVHPNRNIILRAVGINDNAEGDIFFTDSYDMLLMCTDGLTNVLTEDEIAAGLCENMDLDSKCRKLIDLAISKGSNDNITVVLYG